MIRKLDVFKGYTVDFRLKDFRKLSMANTMNLYRLLARKGRNYSANTKGKEVKMVREELKVNIIINGTISLLEHRRQTATQR